MPAPLLLATGPQTHRSVEELLETFAPAPKPGVIESAARGVAQGVTLGYADEISGALESAFTGKTYAQARDESRANFRAAQEANPVAYGAGQVGGGLASILLPGGGALRAAGTAAKVAAGAAIGGAAGLGASEADLTRGELGQAALDTGAGAAIGGAVPAVTGGLAAILRRAGREAAQRLGPKVQHEVREHAMTKLRAAQAAGPEAMQAEARRLGPLVADDVLPHRAITGQLDRKIPGRLPVATDAQPRLLPGGDAAVRAAGDPTLALQAGKRALVTDAMEALKLSSQNSTKTRAFGVRGRNAANIEGAFRRSRELRAAVVAGDAEAGISVAERRLAKEGKILDRIFDTAQERTAGAPMVEIRKGLGELADAYAGTVATKGRAKVVRSILADLQEQYADASVGGVAWKIPLQELRRQYREFQSLAYQAARAQNGIVSPRAQVAEEVSQVLRKVLHDEVERVAAKHPDLGISRALLKKTNDRVSGLAAIKLILTEKSTRDVAGNPTMGQMLSPLKDIRAALEQKGVETARAAAASVALARLAKAARGGGSTAADLADLAADAIRNGVPRATVDKLTSSGGLDP